MSAGVVQQSRRQGQSGRGVAQLELKHLFAGRLEEGSRVQLGAGLHLQDRPSAHIELQPGLAPRRQLTTECGLDFFWVSYKTSGILKTLQIV